MLCAFTCPNDFNNRLVAVGMKNSGHQEIGTHRHNCPNSKSCKVIGRKLY